MAQVAKVERLLELLREAPGPLSGSLLSEKLGVSRTAVWKYVRGLRRQGYEIEALPATGYRLALTPDRLFPSQIRPLLTSSRMGRKIEYFDEIDSTNTVAARLARKGAEEGVAVIAERQYQGRGRLGRSWFSPSFLNLYISFILRPPVPPSVAPQLSLVAGLAVAMAVEEEGAEGVTIKWPNDILVGDRKLAGILTETEAEADRVRWVVVGIGANLNCTRSQFPAQLRGQATSLRIAVGRKVDRCRFTARLCGAVDGCYGSFLKGGFGAIRRQWQRRAYLTGREVVVESLGERVGGRVQGVDSEGALLVDSGGARRRILSGDVTLSGAYRRK